MDIPPCKDILVTVTSVSNVKIGHTNQARNSSTNNTVLCSIKIHHRVDGLRARKVLLDGLRAEESLSVGSLCMTSVSFVEVGTNPLSPLQAIPQHPQRHDPALKGFRTGRRH